MTHAELTAAVYGSLLADEQRAHRHDAPARRTSSRPRDQRVADGSGGACERPAVAWLVGQGARPEEHEGHDLTGPGAAPTHCTSCGRRWGLYKTDRDITGASTWQGDTCPSCAWDADVRKAEEGTSLGEWVAEVRGGPVPRRIPGTPRAA